MFVGAAPLRGKNGAIALQLHVDGPIRGGHEIGDAAVAVHHQAQGWRLHTADREYALVAGLAAKQGEQAAHVHADQPIGTRTAQRRMVEAEGFGAGL
ncbi:hypothetical protein D3C81_2085140 [compost metagenome]